MKNYQEYFIRVFEKDTKEPTVKEDIKFNNLKDVYGWMEQNRDELYSLYGSDCILDLS